MIVLLASLIGALLGWRRAAVLQGDRADRAQYAAVYALLFAVAGLFATIVIHRLAA